LDKETPRASHFSIVKKQNAEPAYVTVTPPGANILHAWRLTIEQAADLRDKLDDTISEAVQENVRHGLVRPPVTANVSTHWWRLGK
jgi:hypothetical protein